MVKKYLLAKTKKQLEARGLGHIPQALQDLLAHPEVIGPVIAYVLLAQCGIIDSLGFWFFFSRIASKLMPKKKGNNHASTKQPNKEVGSVPMRS